MTFDTMTLRRMRSARMLANQTAAELGDALDHTTRQQPSIARLLKSMLSADDNLRRTERDANFAAEWSRSDTNAAQANGDDLRRGGLCSTPGRRDAALVDFGWLAREMAPTPGAKGGFAVGVESLDPVHALFADSIIGMTTIVPNIRSNAMIARNTSQVAATWLVPGVSVPSANPVLGAISMTPRVAIATVDLSSQLLKQSPDGKDFVGAIVVQAITTAIERAVLQGAGGAEPLGLANLGTDAGITQISGASLTWATACSVPRTLVAANTSDSALRWVAGAQAREVLQQRERITGGGRPIWDDARIGDAPAFVTPNAPSTTAFLGDWSKVVVGIWNQGVEIRLDPAQDFNKGVVAVQALAMLDVCIVQPAAFARVVNIS